MTIRLWTAICVVVNVCVLFSLVSAQNLPQAQVPNKKEMMMSGHATGTFEVKLVPQTSGDQSKKASVGRMSIDKQWHGDLEGVSQGEMLTAGTDVKGSAVYVAIEQFTGTLAGHKGSFILHHTGIMDRGAPHLAISVVPDSGIGQLVGLTGTMNIIITEGKHSYDFEYSLPEAH